MRFLKFLRGFFLHSFCVKLRNKMLKHQKENMLFPCFTPSNKNVPSVLYDKKHCRKLVHYASSTMSQCTIILDSNWSNTFNCIWGKRYISYILYDQCAYNQNQTVPKAKYHHFIYY